MVVRDNPISVINALTVTPGVDIATVTMYTYGPTETVQFGYAPSGVTDMDAVYLQRQSTDESDPPKTYWSGTITGINPAIDTVYDGVAMTQDGTNATVQWTQPGLNASPNDTVVFPEPMKAWLGQISNMAERFSHQESILADDFQQFRSLVFLSSWFNSIEWADGR